MCGEKVGAKALLLPMDFVSGRFEHRRRGTGDGDDDDDVIMVMMVVVVVVVAGAVV